MALDRASIAARGRGPAGRFAGLEMLGTAAYCAGRLAVAWRSRRPTGYAVDLTHVLMGTAMAGMLVPELGFAPAALWQVTFAATGCWFAVHAARSLTRGRAVAMTGRHLAALTPFSGSPRTRLPAC